MEKFSLCKETYKFSDYSRKARKRRVYHAVTEKQGKDRVYHAVTEKQENVEFIML